LREALPHLDDPAITAGWRARAAYRAFVVGLSIPEETLEQALDPALIDSVAPRFAVFYAGAFAADRGRWSDHADAIAELERRAEQALGEADSLTAAQNGGAVRALEGYGLWQRGQPTAALPMLEDPDALNWGWLVVPLWLGRLYQEQGRLRDAERVYRSYVALDETLSIDPLSQRQLGKIYEQLGEYDKARESYEYFVHYWQDADPELQPMVEKARQAIVRLEGLRRE
jgi:tetratricopeptide (TPR) repeat protein